MPFLLRTPNSFMIVDEKPRQGIFYQVYSKEGFLRPTLIHTGNCLAYSATLDEANQLHVIAQSTNNQMTYYRFLESGPTKRLILEDTRGLYHFKNMSIHYLGGKAHLFYTVIHPNGHARSLVHQDLENTTPQVQNLVTNLPLDCQISYYLVGATLYILYPVYEEGYQLNCLIFTGDTYEIKTITRSNSPIVDWNTCLHNDLLYVLFTTDTYGHPHFHLTDLTNLQDKMISLPGTAISPTLLSYLDCLWIHYKEHEKLYTLFSIPEQDMFSIPVLSSLQTPVSLYHYYSLDRQDFNASAVYANLISTLRLATLSAIDIKDIHPGLPSNIELALLLEGLSLRTTSQIMPTPTQPTFTPLPTSHTAPPTTTSSPLLQPITFDAPLEFNTPPTSTHTVKDAVKAFINEGNSFENQ